MSKQLLRQETQVEKLKKPQIEHVNSDNPLAPVKVNADDVRKEIFPEKFNDAVDFEEMHLGGNLS